MTIGSARTVRCLKGILSNLKQAIERGLEGCDYGLAITGPASPLSLPPLKPLQPQTRPLRRRHFFRALHALPFSDVVLGAATTDTQLTAQLANGNTRIFDILGHVSIPRRALGRQALLPVAGIGALTLFFRIELHMGRYRVDANVRFA